MPSLSEQVRELEAERDRLRVQYDIAQRVVKHEESLRIAAESRLAQARVEVATLREQAAVPEFLRPFLSVGENEDGEMWCLWIASPSLPEPLAERVPAIYYRYPTDEEDVKREAGEPDWGPDVDAMWAEFAAYHAARAGRTDA